MVWNAASENRRSLSLSSAYWRSTGSIWRTLARSAGIVIVAAADMVIFSERTIAIERTYQNAGSAAICTG
jgi:hypothetical protein